jgi:hypothetical protein
MIHEKIRGKTFSRNRGRGDFVGSSNPGFFRSKCAKTLLQASIISKFFSGVRPPSIRVRGRDGRVK